MKHKHFYSHLIQFTSVTLEIADLEMTKEERVHLLSLADANIHTSVVSVVLEHLDPEDKKVFLQNLLEDNHDKIWKHLKSKSEIIEEKIKETIEQNIDEFLQDIKETKAK